MSGINYGSAVNGIIGSYQHLACIRDNGTNIIYLNGVYNNVGSYIPNFPVGETRLGINDDHASNAFNGLISDFFIYNRALSQTEVALLYAYPYCMFEEPDYPDWMAPLVAGQAISKRFGGVPHMAVNRGVW
jgi:hypothetical protein